MSLTKEPNITSFHCRLNDMVVSLEGLNRSLAQSTSELWSCKVAQK